MVSVVGLLRFAENTASGILVNAFAALRSCGSLRALSSYSRLRITGVARREPQLCPADEGGLLGLSSSGEPLLAWLPPRLGRPGRGVPRGHATPLCFLSAAAQRWRRGGHLGLRLVDRTGRGLRSPRTARPVEHGEHASALCYGSAAAHAAARRPHEELGGTSSEARRPRCAALDSRATHGGAPESSLELTE